jgi:AcrR family transcriptional regulator
MAAPARTPRSSWIDEGLRALGGGGPEAVRIEQLAQRLGVSKGGFYWHFEDRPALLAEMLEAWEGLVVDHVIELVERDGGEARDKLWRLSKLALSSREGIQVELAIRDWARRDKAVARRLRRVDNRRMDYLRSLFGDFCHDASEVEGRAMLFYSLWIGSHFIAADQSRREAVTSALKQLLA